MAECRLLPLQSFIRSVANDGFPPIAPHAASDGKVRVGRTATFRPRGRWPGGGPLLPCRGRSKKNRPRTLSGGGCVSAGGGA